MKIAANLSLFYESNLAEPVRIFMKNRMAVLGLVILLLFFIIGILAPLLTTHDATAMNRLENGRPARLQSPSITFFFGTTDLGRDVYSQIVMGTRVALLVGFLTALIVTFIGTTIGLISGYYGGWIDNLLMRFVDILYSIPFIPFVIVLVSLLKPSLWNIILAIALLTWRSVTRIVRSQVLSLVQRPYVKAARVAGASDFRIIFVHIAPNVLPLAFLEMAFMIGWAIIAESSVSFIGFGDPSLISWGQILHASFLSGAVRTAWWWVIPPGLGHCDPGHQCVHDHHGAGRCQQPPAEEALKMALMDIGSLGVQYRLEKGLVQAVQDVSFQLEQGEILGIVGESGCGKTTIAKALLRILPENGRISHGTCPLQRDGPGHPG